MGRMALTNYLMQTIIGITIYYGVGFGFGGNIGPVVFIPIGLAVYAFQVLYNDENHRHPDRVSPIAPLESCNQNGWHPADYDPDVGDHGKYNHHGPNHRGKIEAEKCQQRANECAIDQTHQQLAAKIGGHVRIDLR